MLKNDKATRLYLIDQLRPTHGEVSERLLEDILEITYSEVNILTSEYYAELDELEDKNSKLEGELSLYESNYNDLDVNFSETIEEVENAVKLLNTILNRYY